MPKKPERDNTMSYTLKSTGETGIQKEPYVWRALFTDGSVLSQFDDECKEFHQFKEIDQSKLHIFQMLNDKNGIVGSLIFNPEKMKLIHFYKRYGLDYMGENVKATLYVFGYETDKVKVLQVITPTGELVMTDDIQNIRVAGGKPMITPN